MTKFTSVVLLCFVLNATVWEEMVRRPVVQDNSIAMVDGECSVNAGSRARIRIKGNQHIVAMSFDLSAVQGRKIKRAELVIHPASETISAVTISTIATPWRELTSTG